MRCTTLGLALLLIASACSLAAPAATPEAQEMILATTTSTYDSGLLDAILPAFERAHGVRVKVVAVGTGQALKLAQDGNVDVVLVHARDQEDQFVAEGWGIDRRDVMYNDFVIVGPRQDPVGIKGMTTAADAFREIAARQGTFASRGDKSGTHAKEKSIWKQAGIEPQGNWYNSLGQGMGDTLIFANEKLAYTITDRGTYLSMGAKLPNLTILVGGESIAQNIDKQLLNPYGVIAVNPSRHPHVRFGLAEKFIDWITSTEVQNRIGSYGADKFGQPLFYPSAK